MQIERCVHCNSTNLGIGYQMGNGQVFPDIYAYHSTASGSGLSISSARIAARLYIRV